MTTASSSCVADLSDQALLARLRELARCEREATAVLIAHLVELDQRRLYLGEGCSSLFTYCTQVLHLSEHAAYGRITAARAARRFPVILEMLAAGLVNLTTIGLLAPHLTAENHREVLEAASGQSKRQVEELVARLHPQPPVADSIRKFLASGRVAGASLPAPLVPGTSSQPAADAPEGGADSRDVGPAPLKVRPAIIAPLAPLRYKIAFTASAQTCEKLRLARDLLRHQIPDGDLATIVDRALTLLLRDLDRQKRAAAQRPRERRDTREHGSDAAVWSGPSLSIITWCLTALAARPPLKTSNSGAGRTTATRQSVTLAAE